KRERQKSDGTKQSPTQSTEPVGSIPTGEHQNDRRRDGHEPEFDIGVAEPEPPWESYKGRTSAFPASRLWTISCLALRSMIHSCSYSSNVEIGLHPLGVAPQLCKAAFASFRPLQSLQMTFATISVKNGFMHCMQAASSLFNQFVGAGVALL